MFSPKKTRKPKTIKEKEKEKEKGKSKTDKDTALKIDGPTIPPSSDFSSALCHLYFDINITFNIWHFIFNIFTFYEFKSLTFRVRTLFVLMFQIFAREM